MTAKNSETSLRFEETAIVEPWLKQDEQGQKDYLKSLLMLHGVVLLRNWDFNINSFSEFVESFSVSTSIDPAREFFAKNVQLVDSGTDKIGLHCENGNTPVLPHLVWFYCAKAALSGSQTTICDGQRVWERLSEPTKSIFLQKRIMYKRSISEDLWTKYIRHHFSNFHSDQVITETILKNLFANMNGVDMALDGDRNLLFSYKVPAVNPTRFSPVLSFANSLLGPSYNYEKPAISFEDGTMISSHLLEEFQEVSENLTVNVDWQDGDVIIIDNTRMMHGRRKILDKNRKVFTSLSSI